MHYVRLLEKGPCRLSRWYIMLDLSTKVFVVPRGDALCWTSQRRSLPPFEAMHYLGLLDKGPCCPSRRYIMLDFLAKVLSTPRDVTLSWTSRKKSLPPREAMLYAGLLDKCHCHHLGQYEQTKLSLEEISVSSGGIVSNRSCLKGVTHILPQR